MNYLKRIGISCLYSFLCVLVLTFILTIFNYFDIFDGGLFIFFMIFNLVFSVFLGGFLIGRNSSKKGWLEGLKFGLVFLIFVALLVFFGFSHSIDIKFLVFSFIILFSSILGGMMGICFSKEKK